MKPTSVRVTYWVITIVFALFMTMDAIGGLMHAEAGVKAFQQLGYPEHLLTFFGIVKILGVISLLQQTFTVIKEWAYAGFFFNFAGAFWSWMAIGADFTNALPALITIAVLLVAYYFWKKKMQL